MKRYNVLFLCTGNSARSIFAEAILKRDGAAGFTAYSAGSFPKGEVDPVALALLDELGFPTTDCRSKSWDEFAAEGAPELDFVFTVCDNAAGETCPLWPGQPMTAHWGVEDPAAAEPERQERAFRDAFTALQRRIALFLALPLDSIDELSLQHRLSAIGKNADQPLNVG
ncbi:MAG: arsenate reductase ArsC [Sphingomicrobium sp.]